MYPSLWVRPMHAEKPFLSCHVKVPVVRRRTHERRVVGAAKVGGKAGARCRVTVVRAHSHAVQRAGQEGQLLLPGHFNVGDVRAWSVDKSRYRLSGLQGLRHRVDGIGERLVEKSTLDQTPGFQI